MDYASSEGSPLSAAYVKSDCAPDAVLGIALVCEIGVGDREEFKNAPSMDKLTADVPGHQRLACCMLDAVKECYKEKFTGDCSVYANEMAYEKTKALQANFGGSLKCDYSCTNAGHGLQPILLLVTAVLAAATTTCLGRTI